MVLHCASLLGRILRLPDECEQRAIRTRAQTKWRLFLYAVWLATEVSRALMDNSLIMSTVTPIFWCTNLNNIGMITTYRNFKRSLIFCFEIFDVFCCTGCVQVQCRACEHGANSCLFQSYTADSIKSGYKAGSKAILLRYLNILLQGMLFRNNLLQTSLPIIRVQW